MSLAQRSEPLTRLLPQVRTPIVCAPMAYATGGALAAAVSNAGGFGFIGAGVQSVETVQREVQIAKDAFKADPKKRLNIGVGVIVWHLTQINQGAPDKRLLSEPRLSASDIPALPFIDAFLSCRPKAVWFAFGIEEELITWAKLIQKRDAELQEEGEIPAEDRLLCFVQIGAMDELRTAVEDVGADVIIVQGNEAGGHGRADALPLHEFLRQVVAAVPTLKPSNAPGLTPALLGAGGLATGQTLAQVLELGAHGGVFGTRFLLTPESLWSAEQKALLCRTTGTQTVRSYAFDEALGLTNWPPRVDGRAIYNLTVKDYDEAKSRADFNETVKERVERYAEVVKTKDPDRFITWSGMGVSLVDRILPAAEVVREVTEQITVALETRPVRPLE